MVSLTDAVALARAVLNDVDVHMIRMRRVRSWPQHRGEPAACGDADGGEGIPHPLVAVRLHRKRSAVGQLEACDIGRQPRCVRADLAGLGAVSVTAFITRTGSHRFELDGELAGDERGDEIAQPMAEAFAEAAGQSRLVR